MTTFEKQLVLTGLTNIRDTIEHDSRRFIEGICLTNSWLNEGNVKKAVALYLRTHRPIWSYVTGLKYGNYWWKQGEIKPRVLWLNKRIKKLEKQLGL